MKAYKYTLYTKYSVSTRCCSCRYINKQNIQTLISIFIQSIVKYMHTQDCRHIGPCTHTMLIKNIHTHTHMHTHTRTHTCTHTHTHTHTHTRTHTRMHTKLKLESLSSFLKKTKSMHLPVCMGCLPVMMALRVGEQMGDT